MLCSFSGVDITITPTLLGSNELSKLAYYDCCVPGRQNNITVATRKTFVGADVFLQVFNTMDECWKMITSIWPVGATTYSSTFGAEKIPLVLISGKLM